MGSFDQKVGATAAIEAAINPARPGDGATQEADHHDRGGADEARPQLQRRSRGEPELLPGGQHQGVDRWVHRTLERLLVEDPGVGVEEAAPEAQELGAGHVGRPVVLQPGVPAPADRVGEPDGEAHERDEGQQAGEGGRRRRRSGELRLGGGLAGAGGSSHGRPSLPPAPRPAEGPPEAVSSIRLCLGELGRT
ncbi:MAG: hypothetical protein R2702_14625 [Acidimicrobiales bacterium]